MAKALDFASIANRSLEEVEKPPLAPAGVYIFQCTKIPEITSSKDGKWDIVNIPLQAVEPVEVDAEELQKFGKISNIRMSLRFMFNKEDETEFKRTQYNLKRALEDHFKIEKGQKMMQGLNAIVNQRVMATVAWSADKTDPELFYANVGRTAPIEA